MVFGSKKKGQAKKKDAAADNATVEGGTAEETEVGEPSVEFMPAAETPDALPPSADGSVPVAATTVAGSPTEEVFVDGVAGLSFRSGVVKLDWYSVVSHDREHNREVRKATHRLVMPTMALQELLQLLQNASAELLGLDVKVERTKSEVSGPGAA